MNYIQKISINNNMVPIDIPLKVTPKIDIQIRGRV